MKLVLTVFLLISFGINTILMAEIKCNDVELKTVKNNDCEQMIREKGFSVAYDYKLENDYDGSNSSIEKTCNELFAESFDGKYKNTAYKYAFENGCAVVLGYEFSENSKIQRLPFYVDGNFIFNKYSVYSNYTKDIDLSKIQERKELYFGIKNGFKSSDAFNMSTTNLTFFATDGLLTGLHNGANAIAKGFTSEGLKHGVAGLGIGLVLGTIDAVIKNNKANETEAKAKKSNNKEYLFIELITNHKNETTKRITVFVLQNRNNMNIETIKSIMKKDM